MRQVSKINKLYSTLRYKSSRTLSGEMKLNILEFYRNNSGTFLMLVKCNKINYIQMISNFREGQPNNES